MLKNKTISVPRRVILSASIGSVLEWYDFSIYAYLAAVFAKLFFQNLSPTTGLLFSYGVFAVGYLARPLGALWFGHIGDTQGRKKSLSLTIGLMAVATFGIGLLPSYQAIGIIAPILLIILRLVQGIAVGGEAFGSVCFTLESIPAARSGFFSAIIWASSAIGMLLASFVVFITLLSPANWLYSVGWRIPFLLAAVTGLVGYYIRARTSETHVFECLSRDRLLEKFPIKTIVMTHKSLVAKLFGLYLLSALVTYLVLVFMPVYISDVLGNSQIDAHAINVGLLLLSIGLLVGFGSLSDKVGRIPIMLTAACGFALLSYPLYLLIAHGNFLELVLAQALLVVFAAGFQGPLMALTIDLIPVNIRYSLGSLGYNLAYSVFGGTAPLIALFLITKTHIVAIPGLYLAAGAVVAIVSLLACRKTLRSTKVA